MIFALAKLGYDSSIAQHEAIVKTIYKVLMDTDRCAGVGSHWQDIGFQRVDPETDIRGAGMLGILHLLHMVQSYKRTMRLILKYSQE